jgi:hypothetical protein
MQSGILLWRPVSEDALPYTPLRLRSVSRRPRGTVVLLRLLLPPGHFDVRQVRRAPLLLQEVPCQDGHALCSGSLSLLIELCLVPSPTVLVGVSIVAQVTRLGGGP